MKIKDVETIFGKNLLLKDTMVIRVTLATVFANKLQGDPLWLLIIAPPASAKTEIITALSGLPEIFPLSTLTAHTLVSGMIGKSEDETCLIKQLDGKILALKDFTSIITMHHDQRSDVLGQLREIYDGKYRKRFGTGQDTEWEGKLGIIAGVTPIIDTHYAIFQMLGERFIQFRIEAPHPVDMALKGMDNSGKERQIREELEGAVKDFATTLPLPQGEILLPHEIRSKIAHLSAFCVLARSGSVRDGHSRQLIYTPEPESPPRLAKQFVILGKGLAIIDERTLITTTDYKVIYKVALDTIPKQRKEILSLLKNSDLTTTAIAEKTRYPYSTVYRVLEELNSLSLITSYGEVNRDNWTITDLTRSMLSKIDPFSEMAIA